MYKELRPTVGEAPHGRHHKPMDFLKTLLATMKSKHFGQFLSSGLVS
jgi:hypothetical protein